MADHLYPARTLVTPPGWVRHVSVPDKTAAGPESGGGAVSMAGCSGGRPRLPALARPHLRTRFSRPTVTGVSVSPCSAGETELLTNTQADVSSADPRVWRFAPQARRPHGHTDASGVTSGFRRVPGASALRPDFGTTLTPAPVAHPGSGVTATRRARFRARVDGSGAVTPSCLSRLPSFSGRHHLTSRITG